MEQDFFDSKLMLPKFNGLKIYCGGENNCAMCGNILEKKNILKYKSQWIAPDFGAITSGYLLLFSNRCVPSIGYFNKVEFRDVEKLITKTREILSKRYKRNVVFFEHGAVDGYAKKAGCCVAHAHIHAVPIPEDINLALFETDLKAYVGRLKKQKIDRLEEIKKLIKNKSSYLLYITTTGNKFVYDIADKQIPSQMFRKYISNIPEIKTKNSKWLKKNNILGVNEFTWDWRQFRPAQRYNNTANYLLSEFKEELK